MLRAFGEKSRNSNAQRFNTSVRGLRWTQVDSGCLLLVEQSNDIEDIEDIERWNIHEISYNILVSRDDLF